MPLRRKLLAYLIVPALLLGLVGISGLVSLRHLEQAAGEILANNYRSIQEARSMQSIVRDLELIVASGSKESQSRKDWEAGELEQFNQSLAFCEGNITEADEKPLLSRIRASWNDVRSSMETGRWNVAETEHLLAVLKELMVDIRTLVDVNEQAMFEMERRTRKTAWLMKMTVGSSLMAALLALFAFAFVAAGRISGPILDVANRLHQAVKHGEEAPGNEWPRDEIGRLRSEMDEMLKRLAAFQDEQRRKLEDAQSRLALIMNRVLEGMVLVDEELRVLAVNRVAAGILHVKHDVDVVGTSLSSLSAPEDVSKVLDVLDTGEYQAERDLGEVRSSTSGSVRVYRPRVITVTQGKDKIEGYLVIFWDVTEEKRFEESRNRFISMLSHQLKTPMTSLAMSVGLLREKLTDLPPNRVELLEMAIKDSQTLASLISELVDAAKGTRPDFSLCPRRVNLNRLLRSALKPLVTQAGERGIDLVQPSGEEDCEVLVDPVKFPWVVTNLVGNALRYTDSGGTISVTTTEQDEEVVVEVRDTGRGMPKELVNRVFTPFLTADPEPQPGTHGLGLAIVREIVEAHGGTISLRSILRVGTTFTVRLPRAEGVES